MTLVVIYVTCVQKDFTRNCLKFNIQEFVVLKVLLEIDKHKPTASTL